MEKIRVKTKLGIFLLIVTQEGLYEVRFPGQRGIGWVCHTSHRSLSFSGLTGESMRGIKSKGDLGSGSPTETFGDDGGKRWLVLKTNTARSFSAYFKKPQQKLKMKLDLSGCTGFERKVYRTLMRVPAGKVISYGELAKRAGYPGAARAVGTAMRKNRLPIVIPCHRVVPAGGGLGEYSAGRKWKKILLAHERNA